MAYNKVVSGRQDRMPRFKPKGTLERNALADLWKHTLSRISSTYGRLAYLGGLRDPNSGQYRHHGLSTAFGRDESAHAMRQSHEQAFREWLKLSLAAKTSDLREHLTSLEDDPATVVGHWLRSGYHNTLAPDRATRSQKAQFRQELEILLQMITNAPSSGRSSPGSTRSA